MTIRELPPKQPVKARTGFRVFTDYAHVGRVLKIRRELGIGEDVRAA